MKNKYIPTSICLYLNYFVHGMGALILGMNIDYLAAYFHPDQAYLFKISADHLTAEQVKLIAEAKSSIYWVMGALGIGRLIALVIMGPLSDKFGRKPFVFFGGLFYIGFLMGIILSPNIYVAYAFAILGGIANSTLDAGTYPALMEAFPKATGTASTLTKAAIAVGGFALAWIFKAIVFTNAYYGWSFIICCMILLINALIVLKMPFPEMVEKTPSPIINATKNFGPKPNIWIEGICFVLIGFTATATFYFMPIGMKDFAQNVAKMSSSDAADTMYIYSIGTLISAFLTSYLVKSLIKPIYVIILYPFLAGLMLLVLYFSPTPTMCLVGGFIIGFTAAGGVLQLGLTCMNEFFSRGKGKVLTIFFTSSSIAFYVVPELIRWISTNFDLRAIMLADAVVAFLGTGLAIIVLIRYKALFGNQVKTA